MDILSELASGFRLRNNVGGAELLSDFGVSGRVIIENLLALERAGTPGMVEFWRATIEEPLAGKSLTSEMVWQAIRDHYGGALRCAVGVLVASEELVMDVFQNAEGRYTVSGYANRMVNSFGQIFLGLDDSPAYSSQSTAVNAAIGAISQAQAFNEAFRAATSMLATTGGREFGVKEVTDPVLASLCKTWFGIPDGTFVVEGGFAAISNPRCPGHFGAPSGYIFQPHPVLPLESIGRLHGKQLKVALDDFVADHRTNGQIPVAVLSRAIFNAFTNDAPGNDMIAKTIIGVMMGFLPTTEGNLREVISNWLSTGDFETLADQFKTDPTQDLNQRANAVLKPPLIQAMQSCPVPPMVWRTALKDHNLGEVEVRVGEKIVVSIVSATEESLGNHSANVFPIFGGNRHAVPHPTHACPGYDAAMGVMLGVLAALFVKPVMAGAIPSKMRC